MHDSWWLHIPWVENQLERQLGVQNVNPAWIKQLSVILYLKYWVKFIQAVSVLLC